MGKIALTSCANAVACAGGPLAAMPARRCCTSVRQKTPGSESRRVIWPDLRDRRENDASDHGRHPRQAHRPQRWPLQRKPWPGRPHQPLSDHGQERLPAPMTRCSRCHACCAWHGAGRAALSDPCQRPADRDTRHPADAPFSSTAPGPSASKAMACDAICARVAASGWFSRSAASGRLGVMTVAQGNRSRSAVTARACNSGSPLLATITGSSTMGHSSFCLDLAVTPDNSSI